MILKKTLILCLFSLLCSCSTPEAISQSSSNMSSESSFASESSLSSEGSESDLNSESSFASESSLSNEVSESITSSEINKEPSYQETKNMLLNELNESTIEEVNKKAIELAVYKPMFEIHYCGEDENFKQTYTSLYFLHKNRGNDAYKKALDNIHFRKALLALFTHDQNEYLATTYVATFKYDSKDFFYNLPTYKAYPSSNEVIVEEGIEVAKKEYALALETGLNEDPIELYLDFYYPLDFKNGNELLLSSLKEVFGEHVKVTYKDHVRDFIAFVKTISLEGEYNFYCEATIDNGDNPPQKVIKAIFNDFSNQATFFNFRVYDPVEN